MSTILIVLLLLQIKHFILDGVLQPPADWKAYWHTGGVLHAGINAIGTVLCFHVVGVHLPVLLMILVIDYVLHFHIDFAYQTTQRITANAYGLWLRDADQLLHQLTYLLLITLVYV
jgi:hypothetical protein